MTTSRRDFIVGAGAALAVSHALAGEGGAQRRQRGEPFDVQALLDECAEALMTDYPESATSLGLDRGPRAHLKARLTDRSAAGQRAIAERVRQRLAKLRAVDASKLDAAARIDLDVLLTAHEYAADGFKFPYGDVAILNTSWSWRNAPYVVAQNTGAFLEIPSLLEESHTIETREDADAYLARLEAYAAQLDGETERLRAAASQEVIAPAFLLDKTLAQLRIARGGEAATWSIVRSLAERAAPLSDVYGKQAAKLADERIAPALERQIAALEAQRTHATNEAGVWKLPQGEAYYAWALRAATTTDLSPEEIHAAGQEELRALHAEMDAILRSQGMTYGTVGERMSVLATRPQFRFEDSDAGRARLIQFLEARVADIRTRLPRAFATLVPGNLEIKRMAPEVEPGAPGAYGGPGTIDGKVPGKFWINLHDMSVWTTFNLPTLAYHESIPGHVWQGEYTFKLPLVRSLLAFNAYSEGWALYAEQLADELGVYENDPFGRLGYLQSIAFRACRLVVDTGLHAKRWSREQAAQWFARTNGSVLGEVVSEVDRYCAWPGQACGYKIGHTEINRLRARAQQRQGARFDLRRFNDAVVTAGGVPMVVLGRVLEG
jgi:uncharacterized protein (DUF885 family)